MKFRVNVTEEYSKYIEVEARSREEAYDKAEKSYLSGDLDMRSNSFDEYQIEVTEELK